jgi:hypothetical protein
MHGSPGRAVLIAAVRWNDTRWCSGVGDSQKITFSGREVREA